MRDFSATLQGFFAVTSLSVLTGCDLFGDAKVEPTIKVGPAVQALSSPEDIKRTADLVPRDNSFANQKTALRINVSGACITDSVAVLIKTSGREIELLLDCSETDKTFSTTLDLTAFADGPVQISFDFLRSRSRTSTVFSLVRTVIKDTESLPEFNVPASFSESGSGMIDIAEVAGAATYRTTFTPSGGGTAIGPIETSLPAVSVRGLTVGQTYTVSVVAADAAGNETSSTNTGTFTRTGPPNSTGFAATPVSGSRIDLAWTSGGGSTAGYRIAYQAGASAPANCASGTTISESSISGTSYSVTGLAATSQYSFRVCAINSSPTPDVSSGVTASATTLQAAPPNPTGLSATAASTTQINLSWTSGGGTTADYRIAYQTGTTAPANCASGTTISESSISGTSHSVTGLIAGTQYSFRICAINGNATPDASSGATVTGSTSQAVPPNPTSPSATVASATQIDLSWTSGGGSTADYRIAYQSGSSAPADCASGTTIAESSISGTTHSVTGLTGGTQYSFRICAINANATPDVSSGATVSQFTLPNNPTSPSATAASTTQLDLSWTAGVGLTADYRIAYQSGATAPANCASGTTISESSISGTSHSVTGLRPGRQYSFRICAINANSTPDVSSGATVSGTTNSDAAPPDPTGQTATAASSSRIDLAWTSGGGSTADYRISYQTGASAPANCASGTTISESSISGTAHSVTGLSASTEYSFRICAINDNPTPDVSAGVTATATTSAGGGGGGSELAHLVFLDMSVDVNGDVGALNYLFGDPTNTSSEWDLGAADSPSASYDLRSGALTLDSSNNVWISMGSRRDGDNDTPTPHTNLQHKLTYLDASQTLQFDSKGTSLAAATSSPSGDTLSTETVTVSIPGQGSNPPRILSVGLDYTPPGPPSIIVPRSRLMSSYWQVSNSSHSTQVASADRYASGLSDPSPRALSAFSDANGDVHAFWLYPDTGGKLKIAYEKYSYASDSWWSQGAPTRSASNETCESMAYLSAATDYVANDGVPHVVYQCILPAPPADREPELVYATIVNGNWTYESLGLLLYPNGPATIHDTRAAIGVYNSLVHVAYWANNGDLVYRSRSGGNWNTEPVVIQSSTSGVSHTPEIAFSPAGKVRVYYVHDDGGAPDIKVYYDNGTSFSFNTIKSDLGTNGSSIFLGRGVGVKDMPGNSWRP